MSTMTSKRVLGVGSLVDKNRLVHDVFDGDAAERLLRSRHGRRYVALAAIFGVAAFVTGAPVLSLEISPGAQAAEASAQAAFDAPDHRDYTPMSTAGEPAIDLDSLGP